MQSTIAIICDCDDTLAPDTTTSLLASNGIDTERFWKEMARQVEQGWDPPMAWMTSIVRMMESGRIAQNTNQALADFGREIVPYEGVTRFVSDLREMIDSNRDFADAGVRLKSYIISSGIEVLIRGSPLGDQFDEIFGGRFSEDPDTRKINGIKSGVTFTEKTKFLYAINKGISGKTLRKYPYSVNDSIPKEDRDIPFEYMIYLGDSPGDIPCFSAIRGYGGDCIGIMSEKVDKGYQLARGKRTTVGPYSANYTRNSDLYRVLETIINKMGYGIVDKKTRRNRMS